MATGVTLSVSGANVARAVEYEVSGDHDAVLGNESKPLTIGAQGNVVTFLTVRRLAPCAVRVSVKGKCSVSIDGGKDKSVRSSLTMPKDAKRMVVREAAK